MAKDAQVSRSRRRFCRHFEFQGQNALLWMQYLRRFHRLSVSYIVAVVKLSIERGTVAEQLASIWRRAKMRQ